ncbi:MAG: hypothetical protein M1838_002445 [Thelocarpon superellum]|nr:MAG: hypothetical protein M1838_002445 [Thelocarpon superellum]
MLVCYYWLGAQFDKSLLAQALNMIIVQVLLLKVALDHRPPPSHKGGIDSAPFAGLKAGELARPYNFWQWRSPKPYWEFIVYLTIGLFLAHLFLSHMSIYIEMLGYIGLGIEATLPIPQMLSNQRARSCKGFRVSVLASWILGDVMKMVFFFLANATNGGSGKPIPWAFKLCGLFQFACDLALGLQFWFFGDGVSSPLSSSASSISAASKRMVPGLAGGVLTGKKMPFLPMARAGGPGNTSDAQKGTQLDMLKEKDGMID